MRRRVAGRRLLAVAMSAAMLVSFGVLSPAPTAAAPQTEAVPLHEIGAAPVGGTLDNQVGWFVNSGGPWNGGPSEPGTGYYHFNCSSAPQQWEFTLPADLRFGIKGLNATAGGGEGVVMPLGVVPEFIHPSHQFLDENDPDNPHGQPWVRRTNTDQAAESIFTYGPATELELGATGCNWSRGLSFLEVTYDLPEATVDTPGDGVSYETGEVVLADFDCTAGAGIAVASCEAFDNDGNPVALGDPIPTDSPGSHSFTVVVTDENGATHTETVTYAVAAAPQPPGPPAPPPGDDCPEDGLQLLGGDDRQLISANIHKYWEPLLGEVVDPLTVELLDLSTEELVHGVNCDLVEPVEDVVDEVWFSILDTTYVEIVDGVMRALGLR